jgi:hypothetical protein
MGSSGYAYGISAIKGIRLSSRKVVYNATIDFVAKVWKSALSPSNYREAKGWILQGDDSLLTLGAPDEDLEAPADRLLFMYYETVEWPLGLAEHWLELALASERVAFEERLKKHGYSLHKRGYPTLDKVKGAFFVVGRRIGQPDDDGVFWQLPEYDFQEYEELPKKTRALAEAVKKGGPCGCPYCVKLGRST